MHWESRFWSKVNVTPSCWLWTGAKVKGQYGNFHRDGKELLAHRVAYEMARGPIPKGFQIDHLCRTWACVRHEHMELVTSAENTKRGNAPTTVLSRERRCIRGHDMTPEANRKPVRRGTVTCRICAKRRARKLYAARIRALKK